jgi:hypothetical protein
MRDAATMDARPKATLGEWIFETLEERSYEDYRCGGAGPVSSV